MALIVLGGIRFAGEWSDGRAVVGPEREPCTSTIASKHDSPRYPLLHCCLGPHRC